MLSNYILLEPLNKTAHCLGCGRRSGYSDELFVCERCGNHKKAFSEDGRIEILELVSIENDAKRLALSMKQMTCGVRDGKVTENDIVFGVDKTKDSTILRKVFIDRIDGFSFEYLSMGDIGRILHALGQEIDGAVKKKSRCLAKAMYVERFPNMKYFEGFSTYNFSDDYLAMKASTCQKKIDFFKLFIPKATPKNMYLMKKAASNENGKKIDIPLSMLYLVEKPETLANLFKLIDDLGGRCHLRLKYAGDGDKETRYAMDLLKEKWVFGHFDKWLSRVMKKAKETGDFRELIGDLNQQYSVISSIGQMILILEKRLQTMLEEDYKEEIWELLYDTEKCETLKSMHDRLAFLENVTSSSNQKIDVMDWQRELLYENGVYETFLIEDSATLRGIGREMQNCISSLAGTMMADTNKRLYGIRKGSECVFMMDLWRQEETGKIFIQEAKKKHNRLLDKRDTELVAVIKHVVETYHLVINTSDLAVLEKEEVK